MANKNRHTTGFGKALGDVFNAIAWLFSPPAQNKYTPPSPARAVEKPQLHLNETADLWKLNAEEFDQAVCQMLERMGYRVRRVPSRLDGGAPMMADAILAGDPNYYHVQPVHAAEVGPEVVERLERELAERYARVGVVVASGFFTAEAKAVAGDSVVLIDGDGLMERLTGKPRPFGA